MSSLDSITDGTVPEQCRMDDGTAIRVADSVAAEAHGSVFLAMAEGVVFHDREGRIIEVNPAAEEVLGLGRQEILGTSSMDPRWQAVREDGSRFPGEEHPALVTLRSGRPLRNQVMGVQVPARGLRWISINSNPIFGEDKTRAEAVVATFLDITERKQAELDLRLSEQRHRLLADNASDVIWTMDRAGRFTYLSPSVGRLRGYTSAEVMQQTLEQIVTPTSLSLAREKLGQALAAGTAGLPVAEFRGEIEQPCKDGSTIWSEIRATGMKNSAGEFIGLLGVTRDISERRAYEQKLRFHSQILSSLAEGVYLIRASDGLIVFANPRFEAMFGYAPGELLGEHVSIVNAPGEPSTEDLASAIMAQLGRSGNWSGQVRNVRKDGSVFWCQASVSSFDHPDFGRVWIAVHEDITERKRAAEELDRHRHHLEELVFSRTAELAAARDAADAANRAKSVFLANMSHELRTPMNAIMGMTTLALRRARDPRQIDQLGKSMEAARHLLAVISDILDISRIEAERMTLEEKNFSLVELIDDSLCMREQAARVKGLRLSREIAPSLPGRLCGDALRLRQILLNFVGNAIKFSERGEITLRAYPVQEDGHSLLLRVEVSDQGIGLSAEQQSRLFRAFTQADDSSTRRFRGSGLGLIISKRIARLMGGDVGVISEEGRGSTFWATVCLRRALDGAPAEVDAADESPREILAQRFPGLRVLLAEDDPANEEVTLSLLEDAGLVPDVARDGREAVERAASGDYALILMDMQMPIMNGLEATRAIRRLPGMSAIPILALTANAFEDDRRRCLEAGMNAHVAKPVVPQALYACLLDCLLSPARQARLDA